MAGTSVETHTHSHSHWNSYSSADQSLNFKNLHTREYSSHKKKVHSVAWNCTGTKLASGSVDQTARIWNIEPHGHAKGKDLELKGHSDSVDQLCWDPKHADLLATASGDKTVRLWDARSGKCSQQVELSGENINITFKPDGTHIAVGNRDDELTFIDVRKFKPIHKRKFGYEIGVIPSQKLVDLLFFAIAAIAANTEKTIQLATEISDSGIKPLALVSQLAALITDILANDFSLADKRTMHNFLSHRQCKATANIQLNEGDAA